MPNFFREYPKIDYTFYDGTTKSMTDTTIKFSLSDVAKLKDEAFYPFGWRDGDRPDSLADKYYDSSDYYWLVLMSNDIYDIFHDLPMAEKQFLNFLTMKYKDAAIAAGYTENFESILSYCFDTIHHYEDRDGYWIDEYTYTQNAGSSKIIHIFDFEFSVNENKRDIRFLDLEFKNRIRTELIDKLKSV